MFDAIYNTVGIVNHLITPINKTYEKTPAVKESSVVKIHNNPPFEDPDLIPSTIKAMLLFYLVFLSEEDVKINYLEKTLNYLTYYGIIKRSLSPASRNDFELLHIDIGLISLPLWFEKKTRGAIALAGCSKYVAQGVLKTRNLYKKIEGVNFTESKEAVYNRVIWVLEDFYNENCCCEDNFQKLSLVPRVKNSNNHSEPLNNNNLNEEEKNVHIEVTEETTDNHNHRSNDHMLDTIYKIQRACCSITNLESMREEFDNHASSNGVPDNSPLISVTNKIEKSYEKALKERKFYQNHFYEFLSPDFIKDIYPIVKTDDNLIPRKYLFTAQKCSTV